MPEEGEISDGKKKTKNIKSLENVQNNTKNEEV